MIKDRFNPNSSITVMDSHLIHLKVHNLPIMINNKDIIRHHHQGTILHDEEAIHLDRLKATILLGLLKVSILLDHHRDTPLKDIILLDHRKDILLKDTIHLAHLEHLLNHLLHLNRPINRTRLIVTTVNNLRWSYYNLIINIINLICLRFYT